MQLPERLFFTGVPGSRWSGIANSLQTLPGFNSSDRSSSRQYQHASGGAHEGAYFGPGMEFEARLDAAYLDSAWSNPGGCRIVRSHDWAYQLDTIAMRFPHDWTMLIYRPDMISYAWWHQAGGFDIPYPSYQAYGNSSRMMAAIAEQNRLILDYAARNDLAWRTLTPQWCEETFGHKIEVNPKWIDILVTVKK